MPKIQQKIQQHILSHRTFWIVAVCLIVLAPFAALGAGYLIINPSSAYIISRNDQQAVKAKHAEVGLVLGAGITKDGKPYKELQSRLDVAAEALQNGEVKKLLLSGDNRFPGYNEPDAMVKYLTDVKHIDKAKLQPDYAGRSTYESCERATKVFGLHKTVIFSAHSHLPRAIYLCRQFGVEAYGVAGSIEANNAQRRELVARVKAVLNVYVYGEHTILGPAIAL